MIHGLPYLAEFKAGQRRLPSFFWGFELHFQGIRLEKLLRFCGRPYVERASGSSTKPSKTVILDSVSHHTPPTGERPGVICASIRGVKTVLEAGVGLSSTSVVTEKKHRGTQRALSGCWLTCDGRRFSRIRPRLFLEGGFPIRRQTDPRWPGLFCGDQVDHPEGHHPSESSVDRGGFSRDRIISGRLSDRRLPCRAAWRMTEVGHDS